MSKLPKNLPSLGDKCKLRGKKLYIGTVIQINSNNWTRVEWDKWEKFLPKLCHLYELEKYDDNKR